MLNYTVHIYTSGGMF